MNSVAAGIDGTTGAGMIAACRRFSLFEWSAQSDVDPIAPAQAKGVLCEGFAIIDRALGIADQAVVS